MGKYLISSSVAQKYIRNASIENLLVSKFYDSVGLYKESENLYKESLKLSSLIKFCADDNEEEDKEVSHIAEEVNSNDVDVEHLNELQNNIVAKQNLRNLANISRLKESYGNVITNLFISKLREGGNNILASLRSLAAFVKEMRKALMSEEKYEFFSNIGLEDFNFNYISSDYLNDYVLISLNSYYKFVSVDKYGDFATKQNQILRDIVNNNITNTSAENIIQLINGYKYKVDESKHVVDKLQETILKFRPDLNDQNVYNYFKKRLTSYPSINYYLSDDALNDIGLQTNQLVKEIKNFNYQTFKNTLSIVNLNSVNFAYVYDFLLKISDDWIIEKLRNFYAEDQNNRQSIEEVIFGEKNSNDRYSFFDENYNVIRESFKKYYISFAKAKDSIPPDKYKELFKELNTILLIDGEASLNEFINNFNGSLTEGYDVTLFYKRYKQNHPEVADIPDGSKLDEFSSSGHYKSVYLSKLKDELVIRQYIKANGEISEQLLKFISRNSNILYPLLPVYEKIANLDDKEFFNADMVNQLYYVLKDKIFEYNTKDLMVLWVQISTQKLDRSDDKNKEFDFYSISPDKIDVIKSHSKSYDIGLYSRHPFLYNIPFETLQRYDNEIEASNFKKNDYDGIWKSIFLFGKFDNDTVDFCRKYVGSHISELQKPYLIKLYNEKEFIGNKSTLSINTPNVELIDEYSLSEISLTSSPMNNETRAKIDRVKKAIDTYIQRSKKYNELVKPNSLEYKKLFYLFNSDFSIRGRDPELLLNLFDTVVENSFDYENHNLYQISSLTNNTDFSKLNESNYRIISSFYDTYSIGSRNPVSKFCETYRINPKTILNIGGFKALHNLSDEEKETLGKRNFLSKDLIERLIVGNFYEKYSDLLLSVSDNELKNKLTYYFFQRLFAENPELASSLNDIDSNDLFAAIDNLYYGWFSKFISELFFGHNQEELAHILGISYSIPNKIKQPDFIVEGNQSSINKNKENFDYVTNIVKHLYPLVDQILNKFSQSYVLEKGYKAEDFNSIPDSKLKNVIIHNLGVMMPDTNENLKGYAEYFLANMNKVSLKNLKYLGENWNKKIKIWKDTEDDTESNEKIVLYQGMVRELISKYLNAEDLIARINYYNISQILVDYNPKNPTFVLEFSKHNSKKDEESNEDFTSYLKQLEYIYELGLKNPLPSWANFDKKLSKVRMRFLPREDPRGMFLGNITECCQHPKGHAASCAYDGVISPKAAFVVFEINNEIEAQCYVWEDKEGNICFDSFEYPTKKIAYGSIGLEITALFRDFASRLPEGVKCTIGTNPFFDDSTKPLKNPTKTYQDPFINSLLDDHSPYGSEELYNHDSQYQYLIRD